MVSSIQLVSTAANLAKLACNNTVAAATKWTIPFILVPHNTVIQALPVASLKLYLSCGAVARFTFFSFLFQVSLFFELG